MVNLAQRIVGKYVPCTVTLLVLQEERILRSVLIYCNLRICMGDNFGIDLLAVDVELFFTINWSMRIFYCLPIITGRYLFCNSSNVDSNQNSLGTAKAKRQQKEFQGNFETKSLLPAKLWLTAK